MASYSQSSTQTMLTQFWAGHFPDDETFAAFINEDYEAYYSDENDEGDGPLPISDFVGSQGLTSYDHDFMEAGPVRSDTDPKVAISASWSEFWAEEFMQRASRAAIVPTHFIMVMVDQPSDGPAYRQFPAPVSVARPRFTLTYLGEIEHKAPPIDYEDSP